MSDIFLRTKDLQPQEEQINYICPTEQTILNLKNDFNKIEQLTEKRLNEMISIIKGMENPSCQISVQDNTLIEKTMPMIQMQLSNIQGICFSSDILNLLNDITKNKLDKFNQYELDLMARQIKRNNIKCGANKSVTNDILQIFSLTKEDRLWSTVPKPIGQPRLDNMTQENSIKNELIAKKKELQNQTLAELSTSYSNNTIGLLNDILNPNPSLSFKDNITNSFMKEDRILYTGTTLIAFSIFLMLL